MRLTVLIAMAGLLAATAASASSRLPTLNRPIRETSALAAVFSAARVDASDPSSSATRKPTKTAKDCDEAKKAEADKSKKPSGGSATAGPEPAYLAF